MGKLIFISKNRTKHFIDLKEEGKLSCWAKLAESENGLFLLFAFCFLLLLLLFAFCFCLLLWLGFTFFFYWVCFNEHCFTEGLEDIYLGDTEFDDSYINFCVEFLKEHKNDKFYEMTDEFKRNYKHSELFLKRVSEKFPGQSVITALNDIIEVADFLRIDTLIFVIAFECYQKLSGGLESSIAFLGLERDFDLEAYRKTDEWKRFVTDPQYQSVDANAFWALNGDQDEKKRRL